jgi:hypothetical protein
VTTASSPSAQRLARIDAGATDLQLWLEDLVRAGLAEAAARPWSSFEQMSARLVDAQAPGLARAVRELGTLPHGARDWPERMLIRIGQLALLLTAWRTRATLEADLEAEVRIQIGLPAARANVLAGPAVLDRWQVLGRRVFDGERMRVRRTWLWGTATRRWALILDFSMGGEPWAPDFEPGTVGAGELCFYPGRIPLRALPRALPTPAGAVLTIAANPIAHELETFARDLGRNPWLDRRPLALGSVVPARRPDGTWWVSDAAGEVLRLAGPHGWRVQALSGGRPIDLCGEWDGFALWPLSATAADAQGLSLFGTAPVLQPS